jgi:predicted AAA+ superfamily ATPase
VNTGVPTSGDTTELPSLTAACEPREDVKAGRLADNHFAAQLWQVVRDPANYPLYGDAEEFFGLTYPTRGLRTLLARTFGRLAGQDVPGSEHGLIRAETSFGGGKTHSLMAVYHLAKGARPSMVDDFVDPAFLLDDCQVAAVVGDELDAPDPVHRTLLW